MDDTAKKQGVTHHHENAYDPNHADRVIERKEGLKDSLATTLGDNRPDVWGKGHVKLYVSVRRATGQPWTTT